MTLRPIPRARLDQLVPSLVHGQALVALVPATGEFRWAAEAAWDVARAAARQGRRVALVDLSVDAPALHETARVQPGAGIVDAFESGDSLDQTAQQVDGVFFITTGSHAPSPGAVFGNPRWRKLQAGFRSEGALLLLYLSPEALGRLSAVPDGVIALAPQGVPGDSTAGRSLAALAEGGAPLIGVVRERHATAGRGPEARERGTGVEVRRSRSLMAALGIATAAAGGWALFARSAEQPPSAPAGAPQPTRAPPLPPSPPRDTLPWTVQLAAYGTLEGALGHADALAADGIPALIAPIVLSGSASIWYRVLAGGYATRDSAAGGRAALWARGAAPDGQGDLLRAPYSLLLHPPLGPDSVRLLGVPATRWPDGRVLVGAFETPEQAAMAEALVARAGVRATLLARTGTTP